MITKEEVLKIYHLKNKEILLTKNLLKQTHNINYMKVFCMENY